MKILTFKRLSLIVGLAFGMMAVWSIAAPGAIDATALRGAGWSFCMCTTGSATCSGLESDCTSGSIRWCLPGSENNNMCKEKDGTTGDCAGPDCDLVGEEERECYKE